MRRRGRRAAALPRRACCRGRALAVIAAAFVAPRCPGGGARRCAACVRCCPAGTANNRRADRRWPASKPETPTTLPTRTRPWLPQPRSHANSASRPRQPRRYFATPLLATDELAFDTKHGLFAGARMRQAVNYALDRPALAAALGDLVAGNYLPPGLPGSLARHVYPLGGPDLARARARPGRTADTPSWRFAATRAVPNSARSSRPTWRASEYASSCSDTRERSDRQPPGAGPASSLSGPSPPTPTRPPSSTPPSAADSGKTAWANSRALTAISGSAPPASSSSS